VKEAPRVPGFLQRTEQGFHPLDECINAHGPSPRAPALL
jgi:hypothetical protein